MFRFRENKGLLSFACLLMLQLQRGETFEKPTLTTSRDPKLSGAHFCWDGACQPFRSERYAAASDEAILLAYRGLFHTDRELEAIMKKANYVRRKEIHQAFVNQKLDTRLADEVFSLPGDGDACCATELVFHKNQTMLNLNNKTRYIVYLNDLNSQPIYQLVPHGRCINYGQCSTCLQENTIVSLLVYDAAFTPPLTFDQFTVPGYCSCKNVG